jgi:ligand-binding SRPBCC domain-containing protein
MTTIHLSTFIEAPIDRVFDLSRSIDLHKKAMDHTNEEAIAGTTSGLIDLDQTVTWKAKHLFKTRFLKSRITSMKKPDSFIDEQVVGDFKSYKHEHYFKAVKNGTIVIDFIHFVTPYGKLGQLFNKLYLNKYLTDLIELRNAVIREYAETDKWKFILNK